MIVEVVYTLSTCTFTNCLLQSMMITNSHFDFVELVMVNGWIWQARFKEFENLPLSASDWTVL